MDPIQDWKRKGTSRTYSRRLSLAVTFAIVSTLAVIVTRPAAGTGSYDNAAIADKALEYVERWGGEACRDAGRSGLTGSTSLYPVLPVRNPDGTVQHGHEGDGQCRSFVNCVVRIASDFTQWLGRRSGEDYFSSFLNRGAAEIKTIEDLAKGDIVQVGQAGHTFIIVARMSGHNFIVVDSNYHGNEVVSKYARQVVLSTSQRAFRMGTVRRSPTEPRAYAGHIVQWDGDTKAQKTAWYVTADLKRYWIPDIPTFFCLQGRGAHGPDPLPASMLDQLPDQYGQHAVCNDVANTPPEFAPEGPNASDGDRGGPAPQPRTPGPLVFHVTGTCTSAGGTLHSTSAGFTPGSRYSIRAWYPDGRSYPLGPYNGGTVRSNGTVAWQWACAHDPNGTYRTELIDIATGRSTGRLPFTIGSAPASQSPTPTPQPPTPEPSPPAPTYYPEQQGSHGANTFTNYHNASGMGPHIDPYAWVEVTCKVYDPTIQSANPDGYWYRIHSAPWNDVYYAVANTFWNGDVPGHTPYTHNTDFNVPDC